MAKKSITMIPATVPKYSAQMQSNNKKRRVAAYARVSTDSDEQYTSYEAQIDYYSKYIQKRADWEFVKVYSDEGISGTSIKYRAGFNEMIKDAIEGKIDLIITKSISRFARNTVDTLTTVRKLKEKGIEVYFEKENIYTLDSKGELLITIMSSLAQEESRSISENVTWGQRKRFSDGKFTLPYKHFLGYEKGEDGMPVIVEEEAQVVRRIYQMFLEGATATNIATQLTADGIPTPSKGTVWSNTTIESILRNEKYKGDALLQKCFTVDFLTKKRKTNEGEVTQYYITGSHPAIISPEVFDLVQHEIERRKKVGRKYSSTSIFTSRIVCGECGGQYGKKVLHSNEEKYRKYIYRCNNKYKDRKGCPCCNTPAITEEQIKQAFVEAFSTCIDNKDEIIENCREAIAPLCDNTKLENDMAELKSECDVVAELIRKCIEASAHGAVQPDAYREKYEGLVERYEKSRKKYDELSAKLDERTVKKEQIELFLKQLKKADGLLTEFDEGLWCTMVESMTIYDYDNVVFRFKDGTKIRWDLE